MRKFNFSMPTKIVFGQDVVKDAGESLALGKKALIVTGKTSARLSGALDDVLSVLPGEYVIFDEVENNPTGENCAQGARLAREEGCDYIIAIGGGSPLDAAKVMAVLAVNDKQPLELYGGWEHKALPIAAIPTTVGREVKSPLMRCSPSMRRRLRRAWAVPTFFPPWPIWTPSTQLHCHCRPLLIQR